MAYKSKYTGQRIDGLVRNIKTITSTDDDDARAQELVESDVDAKFPTVMGKGCQAAGVGAFSQGEGAKSDGRGAHAEGLNTIAYGSGAHAEGYDATAGDFEGSNYKTGAHAEGRRTKALEKGAHAEGGCDDVSAGSEQVYTVASGAYSHAEGTETVASSAQAHAEGYRTQATGRHTHAEGAQTIASGQQAHAEGLNTLASGWGSHAEGGASTAHVTEDEALKTRAIDSFAHAEGESTFACRTATHAEGYRTIAGNPIVTNQGAYAHAEGSETQALGTASHAEGVGTVATEWCQHVGGRYNDYTSIEARTYGSLEIIGNGTSDSDRRWARVLDGNGNERLSGKLISIFGTAPGVQRIMYNGSGTSTLLRANVENYDLLYIYGHPINTGDSGTLPAWSGFWVPVHELLTAIVTQDKPFSAPIWRGALGGVDKYAVVTVTSDGSGNFYFNVYPGWGGASEDQNSFIINSVYGVNFQNA